MDKFEETIRHMIAETGRDQGRRAGVFEHGFTIGELCRAVKSITTKKDAILFYKGYVAFMKSLPAERKNLRGRTEEQVARSNIGWMFGEGMTPELVKMWSDAVGAAHPIFGATLPTPREAFDLGRRWGRRSSTTDSNSIKNNTKRGEVKHGI